MEPRKIDLTEEILRLRNTLLERGKGFVVGLNLRSDVQSGAAKAIGMIITGTPIDLIVSSDLVLRYAHWANRVEEIILDADLNRATNHMMNAGNPGAVVVAALVGDALQRRDPSMASRFLDHVCRTSWVDAYTRLHVDADRLQAARPATATVGSPAA